VLPRKGHVIVVVARNIGERRRADQLLKLEHTIARALAEADSASATLKAAIRAGAKRGLGNAAVTSTRTTEAACCVSARLEHREPGDRALHRGGAQAVYAPGVA